MKEDKKVLRYLELSKEFTSEPIMYECFTPNPTNTIYYGGPAVDYSGLLTSTGYQQTIKMDTKSKLEQYKESKERDIAQAERYEEFLTLQKELLDYYQAKQKVNN